MDNIKQQEFAAHAGQFMDDNHIPGAMIGLERGGRRVYEKAFGFRNERQKLAADEHTVFGIASMTKSFTCAGIMKLTEMGKLRVDDKVLDYLPELQSAGGQMEDMTIHHLMTHTAGYPPLSTHVYARKRDIQRDPSAKDYGLDLLSNPGPPIDTYEEMLAFMADDSIDWLGAPGQFYSYSNDSYGLLGVIIMRASGQSYESFIEEQILRPAKMHDSFFEMERIEKTENIATLYMRAKDGSHAYEAPIWWDAPAMRAVGYLKSSVHDILRYLQIFVNEGRVDGVQILSKESVEQMMHPHIEYEAGKCYGYGLRIIPDYFGHKLISHGGGLKGVSSFMAAVPDLQLSGVILTNVADVSAGDLLMDAFNMEEGRELKASPFVYEKKEITADELSAYTGSYVSTEGMKIEVSHAGNRLQVESNDSVRLMDYIGNHTFIGEEESGDQLQFMADESGRIERIVYGGRHIKKSV